MNLAARIKFRMAELNLTQEGVANRAGISQGMVYKLISGKVTNTSKLVDLAQALECSVEWLATGQSEVYEESERYASDINLSVDQLKRQIRKLPAKVQKEIAMEIMESLIDSKIK